MPCPPRGLCQGCLSLSLEGHGSGSCPCLCQKGLGQLAVSLGLALLSPPPRCPISTAQPGSAQGHLSCCPWLLLQADPLPQAGGALSCQTHPDTGHPARKRGKAPGSAREAPAPPVWGCPGCFSLLQWQELRRLSKEWLTFAAAHLVLMPSGINVDESLQPPPPQLPLCSSCSLPSEVLIPREQGEIRPRRS